MYRLPYYRDSDPTVVDTFIREFPFAYLSGSDHQGQPVGTQVPLLLANRNGQQVLLGHIMRNTDHHKAFLENSQVLAVFSSPHTYVSATWYSQSGMASTWNYMSVQIKGAIQFLDHQGLRDILQITSMHFENQDPHSPTAFQNLPESYVQPMLKAIVGFEILIESKDHVFKLSQNRDYASYLNIIHQLRMQDASAQFIAQEMEKRISSVFPDLNG